MLSPVLTLRRRSAARSKGHGTMSFSYSDFAAALKAGASHFRRGRAGGAPLGVAGRLGLRRRGRGAVRAEPLGEGQRARMGRLLHRGDDRLCRQPDAAARLCRGRPCRLADRPDRAGRRADHADRARAGRQGARDARSTAPAALKAWALAPDRGGGAAGEGRPGRVAPSGRRAKPLCCAGSSSPPAATAR